MGLLTVFLTILLVLDCLLLTLLVLIQLPKKEAGMGQAFGGAATDALFGAGSGNALTKMTKYATGVFLLVTLTLAVMNNHQARKSGIMFEKFQTPAAAAQAPDTNATSGLLKGLTNFPPMATTNTAATNLSAPPSNAPPPAIPPK
ncbi:MAG: preprotein translocase subunit SecG [Verrucomicrobia bacterium]|nr:MAG: preprotein translocase subunit SecG [Verrucomicrobiota bacterium]